MNIKTAGLFSAIAVAIIIVGTAAGYAGVSGVDSLKGFFSCSLPK